MCVSNGSLILLFSIVKGYTLEGPNLFSRRSSNSLLIFSLDLLSMTFSLK